MALNAGDWVEVRSKDEILRTLDPGARLEGMPFMPQMFDYCGKRFQVRKRAHKTCDPIYTMAGRRVDKAVHLDLRCDGRSHGGCQAGCPLFWREEWLKPVGGRMGAAAETAPAPIHQGRALCTEDDVHRAMQRPGPDGKPSFVCQTTELPQFTRPLSAFDPRQYVEDYTSGNETIGELLRGGLYVLLHRRLSRRLPILRKIYNSLQAITGGMPSPMAKGHLPAGTRQPHVPLNLQPGEYVRIKSHQDILATLDERNLHRGLYFDVEMVPYCGKIVRVNARVERFLDEKTGRMRSLKTPALILDTVVCNSRYSTCRMFCPRALFAWWREEWVERVEGPATVVAESASRAPRAKDQVPESVA